MASLYFHIGADFDNIIRLKKEIKEIKEEMRSFDASTDVKGLKVLETRLQTAQKEFDSLAVAAVKAGHEMEQNFKKKIFDASQEVNGFTDKIIAQKNVVKDVEADVRRLGEAYRLVAKNNPMSATSKLSEYNASKRALEGERSALFGLTQEQAKSRLSVKSLRDEYNLYKNDSVKVVSANEDIAGSLKHMVLAIAGADAIKDFISNVIDVAGNFQKMEAVLTNSLGSNSKAKEAIDMLSNFGADTPFQVDELTSSYVKLANQGFTPTIDQMRKLGDLASSTGKSFDQLTEAIIDAQVGESERLKEFGIRASKSGDTITYTFKEQQTTVKNTASAIREYILSLGDLEGVVGANEKISATFVGRLSNIEDELTNQFKDFGEKFNTELSTGINLTGSLVENLNNIIPVIGGLVTAYGSYKAAVLAVSAAYKAGALYENIRLIAMMRKEIGLATAAQQAFNVASKANIYAALISLLLGLGAAVYMFTRRTKEASKVQESLADLNNKVTEEFSKQSATIDRLNSVLKSETSSIEQKKKSLSELQAIIPSYNAKLDEEGKLINNNTEAIKSYLTQLEKQIKLKAAQEELENLYRQKRLQEKEVQEKKAGVESATKNIPDVVYGGESGIEYQRHMLNAAGKAEGALKKANLELNTTKRLIGEIEKEIELSTSSTTEIIPSSISKEITAATKKVSDLKQELADLRNGKTSAEAGKTVKDTIDAKLTELKTAENALSTLTGKDTASDKKASDEQKKALEARKKLNEELLTLRMQNQQAEINLMAEGREKRLAQIEFDYDSEIALIMAKEKEWKEAQGGKLTEDQTKEVQTSFLHSYVKKEKSTTTVDKDQLEAEKKAMNEYLAAYGNYQEKRKAITEKYNDLIAKATTEGEKLSLGKELTKSLSDLDIEANKTTSAISVLFDDMSKKTVEDLHAIADAGEEALKFLQNGQWNATSGANLGMSEETFKTLKDSPEQLQAIKDEIANVRKEADKCETSFNKISGGLKKMFSSGGDTKKFQEGLADVSEGMNDVMQAGQFLSDSLSELGNAFGNDTLTGIAEGVNVAMDAMGSAMDGAKAGAAFGPWGAAAGAAIGMVTSLASSFAKIHDAKNEKRIAVLQEQIEVLDKTYDKLGESVEKAYSTDASNLINQQNKLLEQQKVLINQQIREEEDKKKTDNDRIKEWREQLEEIDKTLADNKEKAVDAIFGEDLKSAIDNFAQAYADAWASNTDKAKSAKDTVKNMMRQMVTESIKAAIDSSKAMEKIRAKLEEFYADKVLTGWEQDYIYNMAEDLQKELDSQFGWADGLMKDEKPEEEEAREATAKGFAAMSQNSADALDGKFSAQLIFLDKTLVEVTGIREQMSFIRDLQVKGWEDVKAIKLLSEKVADNTLKVADISGKIEELSSQIATNTKKAANGIQNMNDKGLIMRAR